MSAIIKVSSVLTTELRIRSSVSELEREYAERGDEKITFDFAGVTFASRSFMDEFHNKLLSCKNVQAINMSSDLEEVLESVKRTQKTISPKTTPNVTIQKVDSFSDLNASLEQLSFI